MTTYAYVLPVGTWVGIIILVCLVVVFIVVIMTSNNVTPRPPPPPFTPVDTTVTTEPQDYTPDPVEGTIAMNSTSEAGTNQVTLQQDPNNPYNLNSTSVNTVVIRPTDPLSLRFEPGNDYTLQQTLNLPNPDNHTDYEQDGPNTGGNNYFTTTSLNNVEPQLFASIRSDIPSNVRSIMFSRSTDQTIPATVTYVYSFPLATDEAIAASGIKIKVGDSVVVPTRVQYEEYVTQMNLAGKEQQLTVHTNFKSKGIYGG